MNNNLNIQHILDDYQGENPAILKNLYTILNHGELAGTGKMIILPVDQGFEHGPEKSFSLNPVSYDPLYHFQLAIDAKLNAFAAPLGMLNAGAAKFAGQIPLILKINHSNSLNKNSINQACIASVEQALNLGCIGVGFTIYPGSDNFLEMLEELSILSEEAKKYGLLSVVWSYARGPEINKNHESAMDIISYAAHMACLAGGHIIKVKLPLNLLHDQSNINSYSNISSLADRVADIKRSCFAGRRLVVFSGGATKNDHELFEEIKAINQGGGNGSIIGRNSFQRSKTDALKMLQVVKDIYLNKI